jgi:glycosyltransferase involved in cell wall biosynthesis
LQKSNKIRVLYIHDRPSGGAGESLYQMIFRNNHWNTKAIVFLNGGFLKEKFEQLKPSIKVNYLKNGSWLGSMKSKKWLYNLSQIYYLPKSYNFIKNVGTIIDREKINIIHTNTITIIEGGKLAKKKNISHFIQVRELIDLDYYQYLISKEKVIAKLEKNSDVIIANSERTKKGLLKLGMKKDKIKVIYNTVSPSTIQLDIRDLIQLDKEIQIVAIVGWIRPVKRIEDFIKISKQFHDMNEIKFVIIGGYGGNTNYNNFIKELIADSPNVIYINTVDNISCYMKSFNLLISTCDIESFGRTVAEALIEGTPAIGIQSCGVAEIIQHEKSGFLVEKSDVNSMVKYTKLLLDDENLNKKMGLFGKQDVEKKFGVETIRKKYLELYNEFKK